MSRECVFVTRTESSSRIYFRWLLIRAVKIRNFRISSDNEEDLAAQYEYIDKHGSFVATIYRKGPTMHTEDMDFGIDIIARALSYSNLRFLWCNEVSALFLSTILCRCKWLQQLHISVIANAVLEPTSALYASISDLKIDGTEQVVLDVASLCPNLTKLEVILHIP